jgi:hypothetical protein
MHFSFELKLCKILCTPRFPFNVMTYSVRNVTWKTNTVKLGRADNHGICVPTSCYKMGRADNHGICVPTSCYKLGRADNHGICVPTSCYKMAFVPTSDNPLPSLYFHLSKQVWKHSRLMSCIFHIYEVFDHIRFSISATSKQFTSLPCILHAPPTSYNELSSGDQKLLVWYTEGHSEVTYRESILA